MSTRMEMKFWVDDGSLGTYLMCLNWTTAVPTNKYGGQKGMTRFGQGFELVGHLHNVILLGWRYGLVSDPIVRSILYLRLTSFDSTH